MVLYPPSDPTSDHVPWTFYPVDSSGSNNADGLGSTTNVKDVVGKSVYIQERWHAGSDSRSGDWLSFTGTTVVLYPKDSTDGKVPWKIIDSGSGDGTVVLQNLWHGPTERRYGMYLGYPANATGKVALELVAAADVKNRGVWELLPAATPRVSGYCLSATAVPEQINLQVASPDSVVVSFVTFEAAAPTRPPDCRCQGRFRNRPPRCRICTRNHVHGHDAHVRNQRWAQALHAFHCFAWVDATCDLLVRGAVRERRSHAERSALLPRTPGWHDADPYQHLR